MKQVFAEHNFELAVMQNMSKLLPNLILLARQFPIDCGVIDLLCKDCTIGDLVVVELKRVGLYPPYQQIPIIDAAIGQVYRYKTSLRKHVKYSKYDVRGVIISDILSRISVETIESLLDIDYLSSGNNAVVREIVERLTLSPNAYSITNGYDFVTDYC